MARKTTRSKKPLGHLPGSIKDLIERLGGALAFRILELRGGSIMWVPSLAAKDHPLRELLGDAGFEQLVYHYAGERLELPKNDALVRQHRHRHVMELRDGGNSLTQIATLTNYTRRQVINVLNASAQPLPQLDLFDDGDAHDDQAHAIAASAHDPFGLARR